jgi:hypothetical protein
MSLHVAAQHLASKGRDGDTELVHMTKGEIKGLQGLALAHGGSLSINPSTGLVEASFLKNLLPMIAGAGLMMIPGVNALAAAGMVGGFETLRTGDIGKGLMAGLGAYGGAGLTEGLSAAGAQTGAAGTTTGIQAAGPQATPFATEVTKDAVGTQAGAALRGFSPIPGANPAVTNTAAEALKAGIPAPVTMGNVGAGFSAGPSAIYKAMPTGTMLGLGSTAANALTPEQEMPSEGYTPDEYDKRLRMRLSDNFTGYTPPQPNPYYRPTGLGYGAEGGSTGDIMMSSGGAYDDEPMGDDSGMAAGGIAAYSSQGQVRHLPRSPSIPDVGIYRDTDVDTYKKLAWEAAAIRNKKAASGADMPKNYLAKQPKMSIKGIGDIEEAAAGGSIGGYSDGGRMLKGPGDGMSDSIPATIGKRQPARLADGEFVVPADVVSHLGNGSTDAGAKKLYSMMDKIRRARTGKKKQAPAVKADRYMPA